MGKKMLYLATAFVLATSAVALTFTTSGKAVAAGGEKSNALFLNAVTLTKEDSEDHYVATYIFDKEVATEEKDATTEAASFFSANGSSLSEVQGSTVTYAPGGAKNQIRLTIPSGADLIKEDGTDRLYMLGGLQTDSGNVTTVRYIYSFETLGGGQRIYRSDRIEDYEPVTVTSVSVPTAESANFCFYIYFSDTITPKKYIDMQVRTLHMMLGYHGDNASQHVASNAELELMYRYQIYGEEFDTSLLYKIWFGCDSYQDLKQFPGNEAGGGNYDMSPRGVADGVQLFNLFQIQEQTADDNHLTPDNNQNNGLIPLVVQIHVEDNHIQFILKGDSQRDQDLKGREVLYADGRSTGMTTYNENIAPDPRENMALSLRSGLLFPNGKILREDFTFVYNPVAKQWIVPGSGAHETTEDETLSNQEGYTDEELAAKAK